MKTNISTPLLWIIIFTPFIYLVVIWNQLPGQVPVHFNGAGEPDGWASKYSLIFLPGFLSLFIYLLMIIIPRIDPKKRLAFMGRKYDLLTFWLTSVMALLSIFIIHSGLAGEIHNPGHIFIFLGILFAVLGNYMPAMRPNYFVGIRTPWTLESERVWRKTHQLAGKIWTPGGILVAISAIIFPEKTALIIFLVITGLIVVIPLVYSYRQYHLTEI